MPVNTLKSRRIAWIISAVLGIALILLAKKHYFPRQSEGSQRIPRVFIEPLSDETDPSRSTVWKSADFFLYTDTPLADYDLKLWKILPPSRGKRELVLTFDHWAGWIFAEHRNTENGSQLSFRGSHHGSVLLAKTTGDIVTIPRTMSSSVDIGNTTLVIISLPDGTSEVPAELLSRIKDLSRGPIDALAPLVEQFGIELFAFEFSKNPEPVTKNH